MFLVNFFCSWYSWFKTRLSGRVALGRIAAWWKAEGCFKKTKKGHFQCSWLQEGAAVSHSSWCPECLWTSIASAIPLTQALKPHWFCLKLILCAYDEREVKTKQVQHRTQRLKFRKTSSNKQAKKSTGRNTCGHSFSFWHFSRISKHALNILHNLLLSFSFSFFFLIFSW